MRILRLTIIPVGLVLMFFLANSCKKDEVKSKPSLITEQVSNITPTTATCGGSVSTDGGAKVTSRGVVWGTSQNSTIESNVGKTNDSTGIGDFTSNLTDLIPNTTYYVRAYATNSQGTQYGNEQNFKTLDGVVVITTSVVSSITPTTATCGGVISADGGSPIIERGVVWDLKHEPIADEYVLGITNDGSGIGNFTSSLTQLIPCTTYYVRAFAINSVGIYYGNEISFTTPPKPDGPGLNMTDIEGNVYRTVWINGKQWMKDNLKTSKFNDGTSITLVSKDVDWSGLATPAYCWYNNDKATYGNPYGALYNWYAVNTGNVCPTGWHVPSDEEWTSLTTYLGESVAAYKLKEAGTTHWISPNTSSTNETGFTALPGGYCSIYGTYNVLGEYGYWWSSTEYSTESAWPRSMLNSSGWVYRNFNSKGMGISIRCVRN